MNKSICKGCRRFCEKDEPKDDFWFCAKAISYRPSTVIPFHRVLVRDEMYTISLSREVPPKWCDFATEQVVIGSDVDVDIEPFPVSELVPDGTLPRLSSEPIRWRNCRGPRYL